MSTITSLKLGSVPITEEGVERYRLSDSITNHFTEIYSRDDPFNSSVGRVFSKMKIPVGWVEVMNANYLLADMEINNPYGSVLHIKGWIDAIDLCSDTEDRPMVEIRWHFDYYEMYKSVIEFGYGHVKRRPFRDLASTPVQNYNYRFLKNSADVIELTERYEFTYGGNYPSELWWIIWSYNYTDGGGVSRIGYASCPFGFFKALSAAKTRPDTTVQFKKSGGNSKQSVRYAGVIEGELDEAFNLSPKTINGVWLSPYFFPVAQLSGTGSLSDPIVLDNSSVAFTEVGQHAHFGGYAGRPVIEQITFNDPIVSTEKERWILIDTEGTKVLELPYGFEVTGVDVFVDLEADTCALVFSFHGGLDGRSEGMVATCPLPLLPINENALSEYVYSGQRDYDREARTINSNANAWKTSASGAGSGAMMGAFGPQGAAVGMAGGAASGLISYGVEMLYQNDEEQRILDRLKANQSPGLLLGSTAELSAINLQGFRLVKQVMDDYSANQADNTRDNFGVSVDEILSSCDLLVRTDLPEGYYSIKNLILSGAAPKEAKDYIKNKFASGVKLL